MATVEQHPDYVTALPIWVQIRDVLSGSRKVKSKGTLYLPSLGGQTDEEYNAYKCRANYVNLSAKVLQSLIGQITKRVPLVDNVPDEYNSNITNKHESIYELVGQTAEEVMAFGKAGLLVDFMDTRAKIILYRAEDIIDWDFDTVSSTLFSLVLRESIRKGMQYTDKFLRLYLEDGIYKVDTFFDITGTDVTTRIPTKNGVPLTEIPFFPLTTKGMTFDVEKAPFEDITDINLSHYRTSADLEQGRHFVSLPTPVVSGINEGAVLKIGSTVAWILPDKDSKAYYLEFQGQGLQSLEKALVEKQAQIAMFSARIIESSSKGSEAAETVRLRYASEAATLTAVATVIERVVDLAVAKVLWWSEDVTNSSVVIIKDFLTTKLTAAEITALTNTYLEGTINRDTFINNLVRGDLVSAQRSKEEKERPVFLQQDVKPKKTVRVGAFDNIQDPQG